MKSLVVAAALCFVGLPLAAGADEKQSEGKSFQVPYRMTTAQHIMVRAKINGKGPYHFIIDTGAPALFVSTALCEKLGIKPDKQGWGTFDRFDIEGGVSMPKAKGRIETPFQLEGMNGLGLAGAELHGIIGYNLLARYRMTFDFTKDKMVWQELKFDPPAPEGLFGKSGPPELNAMGGAMKLLGTLLGKRPAPEVAPRGFLGLELADGDKGVSIKAARGPADTAGLKAGDRITHLDGKTVKTVEDLHKLAAKITAGAPVSIAIERGGATQTMSIKAGEGL